MEHFSITPLTDEIVVVNNKDVLPFIQKDLEKKYDGKITLSQFTVILPILQKNLPE
jgi:hypothetical protein